LADGARPLDPDPNSFVSPSDGRISQCGRITSDRILQAKGQHYSLRALLANDPACAEFSNGFFHTIYLSPRDYHRVHMPASGTLQRTIHVPGRLFSVSPATVRQVPNLFARNERLACVFETAHGPMALVLVGAMLVSSIETVWSGSVTPPYGRKVSRGDWSRRGIELQRGQEMGRFNMGSTVILLLPPGAVSSLEDFGPDDSVLVGQKLGRLR
jgi:phosphatidylserine decarboxylase